MNKNDPKESKPILWEEENLIFDTGNKKETIGYLTVNKGYF